MDDIVAFLTARLADQLNDAKELDAYAEREDAWGMTLRGVADNLRADVAAKRAIIAEYVAAVEWYSQPENTRHDAGEVTGLWTAVQLLARAYDDHPDFDPAWRVT